jgi:hypothetical protein
MKKFSDFNIKAETKAFSGRRIEIEQLIGQPITVHDWKIGPSKYPEKGNGMRLDLQITYEGADRVTWTSGIELQRMIKEVPEDGFPFKTTIIRNNKRYEFS